MVGSISRLENFAQNIQYFSPQPDVKKNLAALLDPLGYSVDPLAVSASETLQTALKIHSDDAGQMFGVLVVKDSNGLVGFLSAYSGLHSSELSNKLCGNKTVSQFLPCILGGHHSSTFLNNAIGEQKTISELWNSDFIYEDLGNCAAIKLFQYANANHLQPLAFAGLWLGASPSKEVRHHGQYYPAYRGKCGPFLSFMLQGIKVEPKEVLGIFTKNDNAPDVIYEDDDLVVVNKPAGLLSVPGKEVADSVLTRLQQRYPDATGPLLLHRLDLATSGLLIAAKNKATHKALQKQFMQRTIEKRYVAMLSKPLSEKKGIISLPLRCDFEDRPRQLVCYEHGKPTKTNWELMNYEGEYTRIYFYPVTGRTHQLRLHAAHKSGLNAPIVGDRLYGKVSTRLLLHAQRLAFTHPVSGERIICESPVPF